MIRIILVQDMFCPYGARLAYGIFFYRHIVPTGQIQHHAEYATDMLSPYGTKTNCLENKVINELYSVWKDFYDCFLRRRRKTSVEKNLELILFAPQGQNK